MKQLIWPWGVTIFIIFFMVTSPGDAADVVHSAFGALGTVADGLSSFVSDVAV
ncbi:hypothetical protein Ga0074812_111104 [Parafrankia irregularis]|uniref:Uncharacterized protein n=1 Tax=Parafrankia irregularis TaxID=795642 RepID=A0A0S4QPN4_9ACTN|nr:MULTISPECIES: hypothetical protein [Frankiaceae]MBE3204295.1 hypothetical protein [Parafrankia sp. CH37]CUU57268.1 hypothetical protein Ga0074812_111104 [Parafrankia irregularis]